MWQHALEEIDKQNNKCMESMYKTPNKKLDNQKKQTQKQSQTTQRSKNNTETTKQPRIINLTEIKLNQEQKQLLELGPNYAIERNASLSMEELIIDTENAIRKLKPTEKNIYRYLATKKIKGIQESNMHNIKHKRQQCTINKLKGILKQNNSTIIEADKSKAIVIINKDDLDQKIKAFIKQNNILKMNKDPTDKFKKQIQKTMAQCTGIIDKRKHKYIINMKPSTPQLKAHIKHIKKICQLDQ